jgi:hypothetical protein
VCGKVYNYDFLKRLLQGLVLRQLLALLVFFVEESLLGFVFLRKKEG